jgi:HK97 family phage major capsid protein
VQDTLAQAKVLPVPTAFSNFRRANEHPIYHQVAQDETQLAMQQWNDDLYMMSVIFDCPPTDLKLWRDTIEIPAVREAVNKVPLARWKPGREAGLGHEKDATDALVSDTAAQGGDWVPVAMSASIFEDIRIATVVAQQLMQINMPSLTMKTPYNVGNATTYLTSQGVNQTPAALDTGSPTLSAKGFGTAMEFTGEMEEDSIAPVLPIVRQTMISDQAEALETALINGDDAATHMDGAAVEGGSGDVRKAWDGFRFLTYTSSLTTDLNTLNVENVRLLTSNMGKYGIMPDQNFWLTGPKIMVKLLSLKDNQNNQAVLTMDKLGPNATIVTGQIANIDGSPLLVSGQYPEWEDSTGIYGDSGGTPSAYTQSSMLKINKRMFWLGNRRPLRIEQDRVVLGDYTVVVAKSRWAFVPAIACNTSNKCAWRGINMDTV